MTYLELNGKERFLLEQIIFNSQDARQVRRAYALIWLDDGDSIDEIAQLLRVSRQSVYNWADRFLLRDQIDFLSRLTDAPRCGRPCVAKGIIDPFIDRVLDTDPRQLGYRSTVWTASLLVIYLRDEHQIAVSNDSVSRAIARLNMRWKRPRHQLALQSATWRQAKGG
ncbi:MAG: helix-turn-helix domain-containing protein [Pyrinomonadaceae bacterium]